MLKHGLFLLNHAQYLFLLQRNPGRGSCNVSRTAEYGNKLLKMPFHAGSHTNDIHYKGNH